MGFAGRIGLWRFLAAPLVALALLAGYVVYSHADSAARSRSAPAPAPTKLTADDLLLAAATAKGIHLQWDGVTGAASATHTNHIAIKSFSWGVTADTHVAGSGMAVGHAVVSNVTLTKSIDKYSLALLKLELKGQSTAHARLYFTNVTVAGVAYDYLVYDFATVFMTNFSQKSSGDIPAETISMVFGIMTVKTHLSGVPDQTLTFNLASNTTS